MMRARIAAASLLLGAFAVCAAGAVWKYVTDEAAWGRVDRSLIRLQSAIRYEAIINVQSRLADADAATREYSSKWRVFPVGRGGAAESAERGIAEIEEALRWQGRSASEGPEDVKPWHLEELAKYPYVLASAQLGCDGPAVEADPSAVAADFLARGEKWIDAARSGRAVAARPNVQDLSQKYSECAAAFRAAKEVAAARRAEAEQAAKQRQQVADAERKAELAAIAARKAVAQAAWQKRWSSFAYRVVFRSACKEYDASVDGQAAKPLRQAGGSAYFGVRRSMYVESRCAEIGFSSASVNGRTYHLSWKSKGGAWLAWIIRPQGVGSAGASPRSR